MSERSFDSSTKKELSSHVSASMFFIICNMSSQLRKSVCDNCYSLHVEDEWNVTMQKIVLRCEFEREGFIVNVLFLSKIK